MTFQSLYRKHRPQRFDEFLGQVHVTTALRNAVREARIGHAYLFSGPRGTGKTTTARVLAKALNCAALGDDGEPCGTCDSCVEIARGSSMDVIELDAASNNGVAEMRSLLERVAFRSAGGRRRVYIVDEVHMLTTAASNALLKTLEEPPDHVVFVLATTESEKVLPTIRSRTQHFEFRLLPTDDIAGYLQTISEREKVDVDDETLQLIARRGAGSVRDALSLFDQALALGEGSLDAGQVRSLFSSTAFGRLASLVDAIVAEDIPVVLAALDEILEGGADPRQVADDVLRYLRNVFLVSASKGSARVDVLEEERAQLDAHGKQLGGSVVIRAVETLGEAAVDMRRAPDPRLVLEVALVRLARRQAGTTTEVLLDRLERLEKQVEELRVGSGSDPVTQAAALPQKTKGSDSSNDQDSQAQEPAPKSPTSGSRPALGAVRGRDTAGGPAPSPEAVPDPPVEAAAPSPTEDAKAPVADGSAPPVEAAAPSPTEDATDPTDAAEGAAPAADSGSSPPRSDTENAASAALDLDDVVVAWPDALKRLRGKLKAMAREAQPTAIDGKAVVLGLPESFAKVHKPVIEENLDELAAALRDAMGAALPTAMRLELHEGFLANTTAATDTEGESSGASDASDTSDIEAVELIEASDDTSAGPPPAGLDSVERLVDAFDATVEDADPEQRSTGP